MFYEMVPVKAINLTGPVLLHKGTQDKIGEFLRTNLTDFKSMKLFQLRVRYIYEWFQPAQEESL